LFFGPGCLVFFLLLSPLVYMLLLYFVSFFINENKQIQVGDSPADLSKKKMQGWFMAVQYWTQCKAKTLARN
jgi:hypothetical protein